MNTMNMPGYGAVELRTNYNRNLGLSLVLAIAVHLALIGLYLVLNMPHPIPLTPPIKVLIAPPMIGTLIEVEHPATSSGGGGQSAGDGAPGAIGTPQIASAIILPSLDDTLAGPFATMGNMGNALPMIGTSLGPANDSGGPLNLHTLTTNKGKAAPISDANLSPDDFTDVQEYPKFDSRELAANLKYPDAARRASIEGTVVVRVLIDRTGKAVRAIIDASDHVMLESAATDAVLATTFTPALQNNLPTAVWMQVPVVFQLR